ncbi:MAG: PLP-dependent aminotransferase family protein [Planctomycetota bacterium]|nr:PLP-dependent aminotransferase family protein [Planctomycetota bacterium]
MSLIDLGIGRPNTRDLPLEELRTASIHVFAREDANILQYGPEAGDQLVRTSLANFLTAQYGTTIAPMHLTMTYGASHALDLILSRYTRPGDTILVEDPTYFFALKIFRGRDLNILPVRMDDHGVDLTDLRLQLHLHSPRLLYTIPTLHNPTGIQLAAERRQSMLELTGQYNCLIVADEVYQLLSDSHSAPPLRSYDAVHVLSVSSFSKILAPGIRLGWIEASEQHQIELLKCGVLHSGGAASPFVSSIVHEMITSGVQRKVLDRLRSFYQRRVDWAAEILRDHLPEEVTFYHPQGGFFLWLQGPEHLDCEQLRPDAVAVGVDYRPGTLFSCRNGFRNCLRICCTYYSENETETAMKILCRLLQASI